MKKVIGMVMFIGASACMLMRCTKDDLSAAASESSSSVSSTLTAVAQTSGQLASGTNFTISGTSSDSTGSQHSPGKGGGHGGFCPPLDGTNLLAPTNELLAIIDAESAGDLRGMQMHAQGGATITNYDSAGNVLETTAAAMTGPGGCSFSGGQFPKSDSALALTAKTVIDFGSGVTEKHDTVTITRVGKIIITRTKSGATRTETIVFSGYSVNGNIIEGTKTRVNTRVKTATSENATSATTVSNGKITFSDGSVAVWAESRDRSSSFVISTDGTAVSGDVTTEGSSTFTLADGIVLYSNKITKSLIEDIGCRTHHGPVSGTIEIVYKTDTISVDFGDGTCSDKTVTITINGVTTTHTMGV